MEKICGVVTLAAVFFPDASPHQLTTPLTTPIMQS
jgi:hypothetical protein